jgi:hypothetical protein
MANQSQKIPRLQRNPPLQHQKEREPEVTFNSSLMVIINLNFITLIAWY